jgi:hypothetical protein
MRWLQVQSCRACGGGVVSEQPGGKRRGRYGRGATVLATGRSRVPARRLASKGGWRDPRDWRKVRRKSRPGTGSMSVPVPTSPSRSGFGPQLSLSYDSGSGNGPYGWGWTHSTPAIARKTEKEGLPRYAESDVFVLSGHEDLVPVREPDGSLFDDRTSAPGFAIRRYRPRIDTLFARTERWTSVATGETHWRSITRDNVTTLYGTTDDSRISEPVAPAPGQIPRVFSWLISESFDDKGNVVEYGYKREDSVGVSTARLYRTGCRAHRRRADYPN